MTNTIVPGTGGASVDQEIVGPNGEITTSRVVGNADGGHVAWNNDEGGTASYRNKPTADSPVHIQSFDQGTSTSEAPDSVAGTSPDYSRTETPVYDRDGTYQGTIHGQQGTDGIFDSTTVDPEGNITLTDAQPDGHGGVTTTVTGQLDDQGNGWFLSENGDRVDKFIDGNGNPATRVIDATSGDVTYEFIENGLVKRNIFNSDGDRIGRVTFNEDGTVDQVQFDDSGQQNIRINQDGSYTVDYRTKDGVRSHGIFKEDGSGEIRMANGDIYIYDSSGNLIEHKTPPDTRSVAEKALSGTANFAAGAGRVALDTGDGALTLLGQNYWDGDDQGSEFVSAWAGLGKTALAVAAGPDFGVEPLIDIGLPSNAELAEVRQSMLNDFIAKDDFQNGDIAYGAGKVAGNVAGVFVGTKGVGAAPKGAVHSAPTPKAPITPKAPVTPNIPDSGAWQKYPNSHNIDPWVRNDQFFPEDALPYGAEDGVPMTKNQYDANHLEVNRSTKYPLTEVDNVPMTATWSGDNVHGGFEPYPKVKDDLAAGDVIDRFGPDAGGTFGAVGTPYPERAMPPYSATGVYQIFERTGVPLPEGWKVQFGKIGKDHGQPGGGTQYGIGRYDIINDVVIPSPAVELLERGVLRVVDDAQKFDIISKFAK